MAICSWRVWSREIDERDQSARRHHPGHLAPLVEAEIGAGRIVAAAMEQDEIARTLGSTVGTVKANFFHALRNLRKLLEERS